MTDQEKRIKLAEAIGWKQIHDSPGNWYPPGLPPLANAFGHTLPDPENDANDDYAVLEWMRLDADRFGAAAKRKQLWLYEIGDYARAALKVLK